MGNTLQLILVAIVILIIILLCVLFFMYYKDRREKQKQESVDEPKKDDNEKMDKKSVFRFMEFDEIEDNMIVQDGGSRYLMVIECKGINYDLLSGVEKTSIEEGFMQFLNTLKHEIQLYIQTRKINLTQSTQRYRERLEGIRRDLEEEEAKYEDMQRSGTATREEILREIKEVTKKRNLYEYGKDIVENTEQMSENRDITTKQYYIVIPYYTEEITSAGDFDKREISSMAFSELYTRAQSIVSGLTECEVRGRILNSQELIELLYVAYNREQYDIYDFETYMNKSGYQTLYSVSEDVLEKRMKALDEEIVRKANQKAVTAFEYATEEIKMKRRALQEKEARMQEYIDSLAEQIVDSESEVIGKEMTRLTKENMKKMTDRENKRKEKISEEITKVRENRIKLTEDEISENKTKTNEERPKVKRKLTDEEKRKRLAVKKRKLMKEREANERKEVSKKQSNQ